MILQCYIYLNNIFYKFGHLCYNIEESICALCSVRFYKNCTDVGKTL